MKKGRATRKSETYFEQIPLEVVKKIAKGDDDPDREKPGGDNRFVRRPLKSGPRTAKDRPKRLNK
jgi:hypothetical protein